MAYFRLALVRFFVSSGPVSSADMSKAVKYSINASRKEKSYIRSFQKVASGDYANAIRELKKVAELFPQEKEAFLFLGSMQLFYLHDPEAAARAFKSAIEIDPLYKLAYNYLAYAYNEIGDSEKSNWAIAEYISLAPDETNPYDTRGDLYAFQGKRELAIASYKRAVAIEPDQSYSVQKLGHMYLYKGDYRMAESYFRRLLTHSEEDARRVGRYSLAEVPVYQGKFEYALTVLDQGIAADIMDNGEEVSDYKYWLKAMVYREKNNLDMALQEIGKSMDISRSRMFSLSGRDIAYYRRCYAQLLAENNDIAGAEEVAIALKNDLEEKVPSLMYMYWYAAGCIEFSKGNFKESVAIFEKAAEDILMRNYIPYPEVHLMLARAYLEAGKVEEAVAEYEMVLSRDYPMPAILLIVKAYYYLGRAYEELGWSNKAIEKYKKFLGIWENADPGIAEAEEAKIRLARLR